MQGCKKRATLKKSFKYYQSLLCNLMSHLAFLLCVFFDFFPPSRRVHSLFHRRFGGAFQRVRPCGLAGPRTQLCRGDDHLPQARGADVCPVRGTNGQRGAAHAGAHMQDTLKKEESARDERVLLFLGHEWTYFTLVRKLNISWNLFFKNLNFFRPIF